MTVATDTALTEAFDTIRTLADQLAHARAEVARLPVEQLEMAA